jgi:hypothetical protein
MKENHKLALYVAYYLSRFNEDAYGSLGFGTQRNTHESVGGFLDVKPATIKNMRDEFDPLHGYRVGWYQKSMTQSRAVIAKALEDLNQEQIFNIVKDILSNKILPDEKRRLLNVVSRDDVNVSSGYILRNSTGKLAEFFFIDYHKANSLPVHGDLIDMRDKGCGYDFEIMSGDGIRYFIEVKGISEDSGGVLFTDKEWRTARQKGDFYFLALISNLNNQPVIKFLKDPFHILNVQRSIFTSIQIQWTVSANDLKAWLNNEIALH